MKRYDAGISFSSSNMTHCVMRQQQGDWVSISVQQKGWNMKAFESRTEHKAPEAGSFSDEESKKATEKAMALLLHRDRTRQELVRRLYQAGFSEAASSEAMQYVEQFGYINDRRYTENYIMFQRDRKSRKEILYRLTEKGIPREVVCAVLEQTECGGEEDAIRILVDKKLKGRRISELSEDERNKITAYLMRKGYEYSGIRKVFSQLDNDVKKV